MARRSVREQRFSWSSCEEAVGRSALISATQTPLCSPKALACLLSCMCANVWHVSGVLMRWIWLVASTDAMDALGVAPAVRTWQLFAPGSCSPLVPGKCLPSVSCCSSACSSAVHLCCCFGCHSAHWLRSRGAPRGMKSAEPRALQILGGEPLPPGSG